MIVIERVTFTSPSTISRIHVHTDTGNVILAGTVPTVYTGLLRWLDMLGYVKTKVERDDDNGVLTLYLSLPSICEKLDELHETSQETLQKWDLWKYV